MIIEAGIKEPLSNGIDLLWTGSSASFTTKTVEVDLSNYRILFIVARYNASTPSIAQTSVIINDASIGPQTVGCKSSTKESYRTVTITSTGLTISNGTIISFSSSGTASTSTSSAVVLPTQIYGMR